MLNMTEKFVCRICVCSDMYKQTFDGYVQSRMAIDFCCAWTEEHILINT